MIYCLKNSSPTNDLMKFYEQEKYFCILDFFPLSFKGLNDSIDPNVCYICNEYYLHR